eukprot:COSAG06_NODE_49826_length_322_cov_4619.192825_1_plen_82_part_10
MHSFLTRQDKTRQQQDKARQDKTATRQDKTRATTTTVPFSFSTGVKPFFEWSYPRALFVPSLSWQINIHIIVSSGLAPPDQK